VTHTKDEQTFIRAAQEGDRQAMAHLVEVHSERIYNLALRLMRNREDAEDVLQETFLVMMNKLNTFSGHSSLYTWLYRIATNIALGKLRSKKPVDDSVSIHDSQFETMQKVDLQAWSPNLEQELNETEFQECLQQAIAQLPDHYRAVFVLRDLEGFSIKEAARILQLKEGNVKVRLMRARLFLRDQLVHHLKCMEGRS
jgi:RNA polymerase sigma-70 factor (ECF subfamily)